jgi:SsrA-binding protein
MIAENRKAHFEYHLEERFTVGMVLEGWEVKSIRAGKLQLINGYVIIKSGELFLLGCRVDPLESTSTHVKPDPDRTKKLLMKKQEILRLIGKVERSGYTLVLLNLHYKRGMVKAEIALAKGKNQRDKRDTIKDRDWERERGRLMRNKANVA